MSRRSSKTLARSPSAAATHEWNHAYECFPGYAADYAWLFVCELLGAHPGNRLYEIGFGSGFNLKWAREHGWEDVAGCDVADAAVERAREVLPGADLRQESIVECSAPSESYDVVIDRAALSYLSPADLKKALAHVRRLLVPGGIFLFNPYGVDHTWPFPEGMPPVTKWDTHAARRLFPDTKWEVIDFHQSVRTRNDDGATEHTLRLVARKLA